MLKRYKHEYEVTTATSGDKKHYALFLNMNAEIEIPVSVSFECCGLKIRRLLV